MTNSDDYKYSTKAESLLKSHQVSYESGESYAAFLAFLVCRAHDLKIPEWVLQWLEDGLGAYMMSEKDKEVKSDLGKCLGLNSQTRLKKPSHYMRFIEKNELAEAREKVCFLIHNYKFTIDEACDLVAAKNRASEGSSKMPSTTTKDYMVARYKKEKWQESLTHPTIYANPLLDTMAGLDASGELEAFGKLRILSEFWSEDIEKKTRAKFSKIQAKLHDSVQSLHALDL